MSKCDEFCDCKISEGKMGKIKDLAVAGVTDLESYTIGKVDGERLAPGEHVREFYRNQGAERERQRIINLLQERSKCGSEHDYDGFCFCEEVALIKGDNK